MLVNVIWLLEKICPKLIFPFGFFQSKWFLLDKKPKVDISLADFPPQSIECVFDKSKMFVQRQMFDWQQDVLHGYFWRRCQEDKTAEFVFFYIGPNIQL